MVKKIAIIAFVFLIYIFSASSNVQLGWQEENLEGLEFGVDDSSSCACTSASNASGNGTVNYIPKFYNTTWFINSIVKNVGSMIDVEGSTNVSQGTLYTTDVHTYGDVTMHYKAAGTPATLLLDAPSGETTGQSCFLDFESTATKKSNLLKLESINDLISIILKMKSTGGCTGSMSCVKSSCTTDSCAAPCNINIIFCPRGQHRCTQPYACSTLTTKITCEAVGCTWSEPSTTQHTDSNTTVTIFTDSGTNTTTFLDTSGSYHINLTGPGGSSENYITDSGQLFMETGVYDNQDTWIVDDNGMGFDDSGSNGFWADGDAVYADAIDWYGNGPQYNTIQILPELNATNEIFGMKNLEIIKNIISRGNTTAYGNIFSFGSFDKEYLYNNSNFRAGGYYDSGGYWGTSCYETYLNDIGGTNTIWCIDNGGDNLRFYDPSTNDVSLRFNITGGHIGDASHLKDLHVSKNIYGTYNVSANQFHLANGGMIYDNATCMVMVSPDGSNNMTVCNN